MQYLHVREWSGVKKVSTTTESDFLIVSIREEDIPSDSQATVSVPEITYVSNIESSLHCSKCLKKVLQSTDSKVVHCDRCDRTMRIGQCKTQLSVKIEIHPSSGEELELTVMQSTLETIIKNVDNLGRDELSSLLFNMDNLEITYNTNNFVVSKITTNT